MNLSVIQTKNLENEQAALGCYISINDVLLDIITPLASNNPENFSKIPCIGLIEIVIKDMRKDEILGILKTNIQELPIQGTH